MRRRSCDERPQSTQHRPAKIAWNTAGIYYPHGCSMRWHPPLGQEVRAVRGSTEHSFTGAEFYFEGGRSEFLRTQGDRTNANGSSMLNRIHSFLDT
ncbi:hypothetical protein V1477_005103 [Vespula maculifrons]|uniref:Uncharacterized protein n=1 Tax=Vespula maculifrons TaxID=7453 RepID=A0ABD2CRC0_VESMC